jgi:hypothetical protein
VYTPVSGKVNVGVAILEVSLVMDVTPKSQKYELTPVFVWLKKLIVKPSQVI